MAKLIGANDAEKIWHLALTSYTTAGIDFAGARAATLNAANELEASGKVSAGSVAAAVVKAWCAVGVGACQ